MTKLVVTTSVWFGNARPRKTLLPGDLTTPITSCYLMAARTGNTGPWIVVKSMLIVLYLSVCVWTHSVSAIPCAVAYTCVYVYHR